MRRSPRWPSARGYGVGRYYDPTTGQFLSVDSDVDQTGQPYAYVNGDPVNNRDPSGACVLCSNPVGIVSGATHAWNATEAYATYDVNFWAENWRTAA